MVCTTIRYIEPDLAESKLATSTSTKVIYCKQADAQKFGYNVIR